MGQQWQPPSFAAPVDDEEDKPSGLLSAGWKLYDEAGDFISKHPVLRRLLTGPDSSELKYPLAGQNLQEIPGVSKASKRLADTIDPTNARADRGFIRPFLAGATEGLGGLLATGTDPRSVAVGKMRDYLGKYEVKDITPLKQGPKLLGPSKFEKPATSELKRKFIGGEAGVAEGRPYSMDIGPTKLLTGEEGTVLPHEIGEVTKVPPDYAARSGLSLGRPLKNEYFAKPKKLRPAADFNVDDEGNIFPRSDRRFQTPPKTISQELQKWEPPDYAKPEEPSFSREGDNSNIPSHPTAKQWWDHVQYLDSINAPDYKYRDILSTGGRDNLKRGETWRSRVMKYIDLRDTPPEDASFARSGTGGLKIGADVESLGKILGSSLYKGDIAKIATKELLQNSLDAVRHLDKDGQIDVHLNSKDNFVEVKDNGKGLTRKELETVFTDLGSSGKRDDATAIGGFGLAKAAPLLGGERVEVISISKEKGKLLRHYFEGTPDELLKGIELETTDALPDEKTGLTVRTYVPKDSDFWNTKSYVQKLVRNSKISSRVNLLESSKYSSLNKPAELLIEAESGKSIATLDSDAATTKISIPKNVTRGERSNIEMHFANNGMWQGSQTVWLAGKAPNIPAEVLVDIHSKVPEGHGDYPFTANREELRGSVETQVKKYINDTLVKPALEHRTAEIQALYDGMPEVPIKTKNGQSSFFIYDVGGRLQPEEMEYMLSKGAMQNTAAAIHDAIYDTLIKLGNDDWYNSIEKVGLLFDESDKGITFGVNIPNPATKQHAILINPLSVIKNAPGPDEAASGISHVILHEIAHEGARSEGAEFTAQLAKVYRTIGRTHENEINESIFKAISNPGNRSEYHPEFQELLQIYSDSRGRSETTPDLLSGTASQSRGERPDRKKQVPLNSSPIGTGATSTAVGKLLNAVKNGELTRNLQDSLYSKERGKRASQIESVKTKGLAGFHQQLGLLKGELPKVPVDKLLLNQQETDTLIDSITDSQLSPYEKINAKTGLVKLLGGMTPQRYELGLMGKVFGKEFEDTILMHGGIGQGIFSDQIKLRKLLNESVNLPKSFMASLDLSAPLRQGLPMMAKKQYWNAFSNMFKYFGSTKAFVANQEALAERPLFQLGEDSGLQLTDVGSDLTHREEQFISHWASSGEFLGKHLQKPYQYTIGAAVSASERAYVGFLNKLRADVFDDLANKAQSIGELNRKTAQDIAKFVNTSTGRGNLGRFEKNAVELNALFFSPRMIASRLTMMNPVYYYKLEPNIRKEALKALLTVAGAALTVAGLGKLAGASVETDPTNSDFMKVRFGKTRIDPMAGFQQYIVAAARLISGKTTSSTSGRTREFNKGYNAPTRWSTTEDFTTRKLSPVASFAYNLLKGVDWQGKPIDMKNEIQSRFTPLIIQDITEVYQNDPNLLPITIPAATFGMSIQSYSPPVAKPKTLSLR